MIGWKLHSIAGGVCFAIGLVTGWTARDALADRAGAERRANEAADFARATQLVLRRLEETNDVSARVGQASASRQVEIRSTTNELIREVPIYVQETADHGCVVPNGFVRLHDAAATGAAAAAISKPAAPPHDAPSGIELSEVGSTLVSNLGQCRAELERLSSLQEWVRAQQRAWGESPRSF